MEPQVNTPAPKAFGGWTQKILYIHNKITGKIIQLQQCLPGISWIPPKNRPSGLYEYFMRECYDYRKGKRG